MASMHSVTLDEEGCSHYYHCILSGIPQTMPLQMIADYIVPKKAEGDETCPVARLEALGCRIVPHKLHTFKEKMPTKFGFVTYFIHHTAEGSRDDILIHSLFLQWVTGRLQQQMLEGVCVKLGQPFNCCQAGPFLRHLHATCKLLSTGAKDLKKVETFLLAKVVFSPFDANEIAEGKSLKLISANQWGCEGTIAPQQIPAYELAWLRTEHSAFPEKVDVEALTAFFKEMVSPTFSVIE